MPSRQAHVAADVAVQPAFHGDDEWVHTHLKNRDAEHVRCNSPDGGYTSVETVRFNRAEFTKQIQVIMMRFAS